MPVPSKIDTLAPFLACPACHWPLQREEQRFVCAACRAEFPLENGVPKLVAPNRRAEIDARLAGFRDPHAGVRANRFFRALIPPDPVYDPGARARHARIRAALAQGVVLNLGSKATTWGEHVVNVDLAAPADLLADIAQLPFADNSVDGVICSYVLEHVSDAQACLDEICRVLKPGGQVYVTVPFIFPTHPDPLDRRRWTLDGLRHALCPYEETAAGPCGGPCSAFVALMPTLAGSVFSNFFVFNAVRFGLGWLLWPVKFLDVLAARSRRAYISAPAFFFLGRKRTRDDGKP
jgi:SAM-dependent methyltransferase/uncharacterized protein YbaR (Trm112 family)